MTRTLRRLARRLLKSRRLDALERRLGKTEERLTRQGERLKRQGERLRRQRALLDRANRTARRTHSLFEILSGQIGGIEERLQNLTEKVELGRYDATDEEKAQARTLLEEIREEHRRIRVRFGVVARYEERVRRLESALAEEMAAAAVLAHDAATNGAVAYAPAHGAVDLPEDPPATPAPAAPPRR
jgi:predicted  nucleic acid-binding Zn-ribbon protein